MASSSAISMIHTPSICCAASFDPISASSSVNQSAPASVFRAVDFRAPCGEDQHVVGLDAGTKDAGDGGDQPEGAGLPIEVGGLGPEIALGPGLDAGHAVPAQGAEIVPNRVPAQVARQGADAAADG